MKQEIIDDIESTEVIDRDGLCVVYMIEKFEAISGKDRVELVRLKDCGYTVICEKGLHKVGDLIMFVKYDSIVPDIEMFSWMKEFKFRVKPKSFTVRNEDNEVVDKIYSQGIVIKLEAIIDYIRKIDDDDLRMTISFAISNIDTLEGLDLTHMVGIKKYIPPVINSGSSFGQMIKKGDFPTHIVSKTDELNLASRVRALDEIQGKRVYITLKIEGSSLTGMYDDGRKELMLCTRNNQIGEHETSKFWQAANRHNLKEACEIFPDYVFQGELYGPGIQKNKLGIAEADLAIFNIVDKRSKVRLAYDDMVWFCTKLDLPMVPLVMIIEDFKMTFDELQRLADVQTYANGESAEGIVIRPCEPVYSKVLKGDWSVKVINRDYRL